MGNCICGTLNCLSSTMLGIIRCILFVGCVLSTLSAALELWALYMIETNVIDLQLPCVTVTFQSYLVAFILLIVSIIGAHGAYSKNPKYLKLFALFISCFTVIYFCSTAIRLSSTDWVQSHKMFEQRMTTFAKEYEYDVPLDQEPNKGTRAWNMIQTHLTCCGLEKPEDWVFGPLNTKSELPRSCCANLPRAFDKQARDQKCTLNSKYLFDVGCSKRVDYLIERSFAHAVVNAFIYLVLAVFALILARDGAASQQLPVATVYASPSGGPVYERFGGSVYVRTAGGNNTTTAQTGGNNMPKQPPVAPGSLYPSMDLPPPRYQSS